MRKLSAIIFVLLFVMSFGVISFAQQPVSQGTVSTQTVSPTGTTTIGNTQTTPTIETTQTGGLPIVTIDDASSWAERKGYEVVGFLQTVVQPFAVIIFIICAFLALVGAFGNSQLVGKGIWGMFIAVIMYAVVLYAPEILDFILRWLKS